MTLYGICRGSGARGPLQVVGHPQGGRHCLPRGEAGSWLQVSPSPSAPHALHICVSHSLDMHGYGEDRAWVLTHAAASSKSAWSYDTMSMPRPCADLCAHLPLAVAPKSCALLGRQLQRQSESMCILQELLRNSGCWRGCRQTTKDFMGVMPSVYDRILSCFALGLGYPEDFFKEVCLATPRPLLCCCRDGTVSCCHRRLCFPHCHGLT